MKAVLPFPEYVAQVSGYTSSDIAEFHKDTERWLTLDPQHERIRHPRGLYVISYLTNTYLYLNDDFARIVEVPMSRIYDTHYWNKEDRLYRADREIIAKHVIANNMAFFRTVPRQHHPEYVMRSTYRIHAKDGGLRGYTNDIDPSSPI